jgi:hypothetical protein
MASSRYSQSDSDQPAGGVRSDVQRVKEQGTASVAELREFVSRMHGKSPQEMLGVVAQSRLAVSIIVSAIGCVVLLFSISLFAYYFGDSKDDKQSKAPVASKSSEKTESKSKLAGKSKTGAGTNPDIAKKLGHKGVKTGTIDIDNILDRDKTK